jgi:hypothetical protein
MAKAMLTLKLDPDEASIEKVRRKLKLKGQEIDETFGVVPIDPRQNLYAVRVDEDVADNAKGEGVSGPFADPEIESFGPPER